MALVFERGVFLSHKGLNKEIIIKAAADLIETQGRECFSMRLLADSLQVKTASLYNHIKSMDELITSVCEYGLQLQKEMEMDAVKEQHGEQAVRILADTYRLFAKEHRQLYWLIMNTAAKDHQVLDDAAILITDPLKKYFRIFIYKVKNWSITAGYSELSYTVLFLRKRRDFSPIIPPL